MKTMIMYSAKRHYWHIHSVFSCPSCAPGIVAFLKTAKHNLLFHIIPTVLIFIFSTWIFVLTAKFMYEAKPPHKEVVTISAPQDQS